MRRIFIFLIVCWLGTTLPRAAAEEKKPTGGLSKQEVDEGFVSIFDGKTLNGWKGATTGYTAEDGLLICQKKGGGNLFTTREFGDFIFRFDFKLEPGGNNGVSVRGHEIQILDDYAPQHKNIKPCQYHGSIYCKVPAKRGHTKPAGEWNTEEIYCKGSHWKVTVNGVVIVDADIATVDGLQAVAKRTRAPLGFLGHGTRVEFRNLRVKELTAGAKQEKDAKTRILFIGKNPDHPYGSHMYMHTSEMLAKCVELTPRIQTVVSNGWPKDAKLLEGVKSIVIYTSPAAELLLESPHRDQVDELMKKGVGLVTIHWASSIYQKNLDRLGPTWLSYLGGTWVSNVGLSGGKSPLKQMIADHPICRGWKEYEIEDEYYLDPVIKQAKPLLSVQERKGKTVIVGWVYERKDGGRAFGTTLGHPYKNFQIEAFRRMIVNGILWSAHVDVPQTGAPVNLSEEALALPPKK